MAFSGDTTDGAYRFPIFLQYLTKQNIALKEVNDSRMQIYESLDVSIRDLELEKYSLTVQTSKDKNVLKT